MMYKILHTKQALKDSQSVKHAGLGSKAKEIEKTVKKDPFEKSQGFERLTRDLKGACSRRINRQQRYVYQVLPNSEKLVDEKGVLYEGIVKVISMWTHYHE